MASGFGDFDSLLKQAQDMNKRYHEALQSLAERSLEGSSGGGAVKAVVNGNQELLSISIQRDAVDPDDVEGLEDLVTTAVRQALAAASQLKEQELKKVTGGMNLPGMGF